MNRQPVDEAQTTSIYDTSYAGLNRVNDRVEYELERFITGNKKLSKNRDKFFTNARIEKRPIGFMEFQEVYTWRKNVIMVVTF